MTLLGKILVFLNVALSVGMMAVAFGLYTNRIDWFGKEPGEYGDQLETIRTRSEARDVALARWSYANSWLAAFEYQRPARENVYQRQLAILEGSVEGKVGPLRLVNGVLQWGQGVPQIENSDLKSRRGFQETLAARDTAIREQMKKVKDLEDEEDALTAEVNGKGGMQKGLRDLLAEEDAALANATAERQSLKTLRCNREAEGDLLLKRQASLTSRLNELKRIGVAAREP